MISHTGIFLVAFLGFFSAVCFAAQMKCSGVAEYEVKFDGKWNNTNHPNAYPATGKFSPWVGASHDMDFKLWVPGMEASPGVQEVAETGVTTEIMKEIDMGIMKNKTAWKKSLAGSDTAGSGHWKSQDPLEVTADYPMVSMISGVRPSPDWFIGKKDVNLCDNGTWRDALNITDLQPWDAGTDDGNMFNSTDAKTDPQGKIELITKDSGTPFKGDPIKTLGMLMFRRVNKPTMHTCTGEQKYRLEFQGMWSNERQPLGFPDGAKFSKLIGCTHKYNLKFWSPMTKASDGVQKVAESGDLGTLKTALESDGRVNKVYTADNTTGATASREMEIMVTAMYSSVSVIAMVVPSSDWFIGVDSLDLCGSDGWKDTAMISSPAYDAGTENGKDFASTDVATMPQDVILKITKDSDTVMKGADDIKDFAKFTFTKYKAPSSATTAPTDSAQNPSAGISLFLSVAFLAILRFLY